MRILITGATGFIGKKLLARLVEAGHEAVVLTRSVDRARRSIGYPCTFHPWQGRADEIPSASLEGVDAVFHLAGESIGDRRWTEVQKRRILETRVWGTRELVAGIKAMKKPPQVVICASAIGFYGDAGDKEVDETSPAGTGFLAEVCKSWEAELKPLETLCRVVSMRTGIVLGEGGGILGKLVPIFQSGLGGAIGSGKQWMSWIHIDDQISLYLWALESSVAGPVNAVAPAPVTNAEFSQTLAQVLKKTSFFKAPAAAVKAMMGEMSVIALAGQKVKPAGAMSKGFAYQFPTLASALENLLGEGQGNSQLLEREQFVPLPPEEIFPFFSEAKNLENITPPWIGFRVLSSSTLHVEQGTVIDYRLFLHGIPMRWRTLIEKWDPNRSFVDSQVKGPYRLWHHTHLFVPVRGGTVMKDVVRYRLPGGRLGRLIAGRFVQSDVDKIFEYRRKKVEELFCRKRGN